MGTKVTKNVNINTKKSLHIMPYKCTLFAGHPAHGKTKHSDSRCTGSNFPNGAKDEIANRQFIELCRHWHIYVSGIKSNPIFYYLCSTKFRTDGRNK
jgi:hypothetical protein